MKYGYIYNFLLHVEIDGNIDKSYIDDAFIKSSYSFFSYDMNYEQWTDHFPFELKIDSLYTPDLIEEPIRKCIIRKKLIFLTKLTGVKQQS